jgi:hypothetical protein
MAATLDIQIDRCGWIYIEQRRPGVKAPQATYTGRQRGADQHIHSLVGNARELHVRHTGCRHSLPVHGGH